MRLGICSQHILSANFHIPLTKLNHWRIHIDLDQHSSVHISYHSRILFSIILRCMEDSLAYIASLESLPFRFGQNFSR